MDPRITSYLPRLLLNWYGRHAEDEVHDRTDHAGILLFADTSGFTALTRALAERGKIGFEILTDLLNSLFRSLEQTIVSHDGDILKFSGDAVWCYFPPGARLDIVFAEMLFQVEELNRIKPVCREHKLSLHAGATSGEFELISIGDVSRRLEFEIAGDIVPIAYHAADVAGAGELALIPSLAEALPIGLASVNREGLAVISPKPLLPSAPNLPSYQKHNLSAATRSIVEKYLPEAVRARKLGDRLDTGLQSEHRLVTVLFANILLAEGPNRSIDNGTLTHAKQAISDVFHIIERNHGIVARVDPFVRGHKLLALFGALHRSDSDRLNALQAADAIRQLPTTEINVRMGLSAGPLLCGEVGSAMRHEYTVMGEAVNLAARLMSKADDHSILIDAGLYDHLRELTAVTERRLKLKGVGDNVAVYRFESWRQSRCELPRVGKLIGREEPLQRLEKCWQSRSEGAAKWVFVDGEPGIGKTSLVSRFASTHLADQPIYLTGYGAKLYHPGWLIAQWLLRAASSQCSPECSEEQLIQKLAEQTNTKWRPLFDQIFGISTPDNEWTRGLSVELRMTKLAEMVAQLLEQNADGQLVILDDLSAADSLSLMILEKLQQQDIHKRLLVLAVDAPAHCDDDSNHQVMALSGLTAEQMSVWLAERFVVGAREKELFELLIGRSEGNPLFVNETLTQLAASGVIGHLTSEHQWEVLKPLDEIKMADRLQDLQLARFDSLPESHRQVLKIASVIDGAFSAAELQHLAQTGASDSLTGILQELVDVGMLSFDQVKRTYSIAREMTRKAIYDCVPQTDLEKLHSAVGKMLLESNETPDIFRLAYHFSRGDDPNRAFEYSLRAGKLARDKGLLVEAASSLRRCNQLLQSEDAANLDPEAKLEFLHWATEFSVQEGNYDEAQRLAHAWRKLATVMERPLDCHAAANELARVLSKRSKYSRSRQVLSRLADIDATLSTPSLSAVSYSLFTELLRRTGKLTEARDAGTRAVELAKRGDDRAIESDAHNSLGLAFWAGGKLADARDCFLKSMELQRGNGSMHTEARVANNLAIIAEETGDYNEARRLARKAKDIFAELGDRRNQAYASGTLANLLIGAGQYRDATELYHAADKIFVRLGETHPHYYTVGNLGDLDLLLGDFDAALTKYHEVVAFARESGDEELDAELAVRLAEHSYYNKRSSEARALYEDAIAKAEKVGSMEYRIRGTVGLCRFLIGERNVADASAAVDRLKEFAEESHSDRNRYEAAFLSGELQRIKGEIVSSLPFYKECASYACEQQHFELALKSLVRLVELPSSHSPEAANQLGKLLTDFREANGAEMFEMLMNSRYFKFFYKTMKLVCDSMAIAPIP